MAGRRRVARKREELRDALWPNLAEEIWPQPKESGWCRLPRVMPIILRILAEKNISGDMDLSRTYLGLWCDNYGEGIVEVEDEHLYAETAGLRGDRGVRSWRARVRRLAALDLLRIYDRATREVGFVAILHPYKPLEGLHARGLVPDGWWAILRKRLLEVGAGSELAE